MKKIVTVLSISILLLLGACASTGTSNSQTNSNQKSGPTISLNPDAENFSFWLMFGIGVQSCSKDYQAYAFEIEYCAFKLASLVAAESNDGELAMDSFSKMLRAANDKGYNKEFAFAVLSNNSMYSDYGLRMTEFKAWFQGAFPEEGIPVNNSVSVELVPKELDDSLFSEISFKDDYPVGFSDFVFDSEKGFEKKYLGKSLNYQHNQNQSAITFYVYPVFYPAYLKEGINPIFDAMTEVKQGVISATQQGYYKDLKILEEKYLQDKDIAFAKYAFKKNGQQYQSFTYLTTHNNNLLKVRATFDENTTDDYHQDILTMIDAIKQSIN